VIRKDQTINTFVLPGGKIGVYTGIFPVAQTEAGMAITLGHEMGHAIARHATERLSQQLRTQLVSTVLAAGLQGNAYGVLTMAAFGLGAQLGVLLPYSRLQEEAADRIGLVLSAQAGYDPQAAVGVWERMAKVPGSPRPNFSPRTPSLRGASRISNSICPRPWPCSVPIPTREPGPCQPPRDYRADPISAQHDDQPWRDGRHRSWPAHAPEIRYQSPARRRGRGGPFTSPPRPNTLCRMVPDPRA
jgi:Peptidase family M48